MSNLTEHLESRHLDLELHRPMVDDESGVATFWLYTLAGVVMGFIQYRPTGAKGRVENIREVSKYFTLYSPNVKSVACWGLESFHRPGPLFLTEGLFDAARLTSRGAAAIAALGNDPGKSFSRWLGTLSRPVVAVCDGDAAGKKLAKYGNVAVGCSM